MSFADDAEELATDLAFWYEGLKDPDYSMREIGKLSQEVAVKFRALGIMLLLSEGSTDLFFHNLARAGNARLVYLRRMETAGKTGDFFQGSGRYGGLMSAIAAAHWPIVDEIVALSPTTLVPGEYEEDYLFAQIIHRLVRPHIPPLADFQKLFDQFEAVLDGAQDPRLDVCRSLVAGDQAAFDAAFDDILLSFEDQIDKAIARGQHEEPVTLAQREVCVDALALLRLAELHKLKVADEYRFCPSLARRPMRVAFPTVL